MGGAWRPGGCSVGPARLGRPCGWPGGSGAAIGRGAGPRWRCWLAVCWWARRCLGDFTPLQASAPGPGIRLVDLSDYPTHTTVDRFEVEVVNLTTTAAYQVIVSSDSAGLGIGACGTASQTQKVTGVAAQTLELFVYACAEGGGTVTAELRSAGSTTSLATVSQRLVVEAVPELAPGSGSTTTATAKSGSTTVRSAARVGTPGTVPSISFPTKTTSSIKVTWGKPSDGGRRLTGFGLLFWRTSDPDPAYSSALVKGRLAARAYVYRVASQHDLQVPHPRLQRPGQLRLVDAPAQGGVHAAGAAPAHGDGDGHSGAGGPPRRAAFAQPYEDRHLVLRSPGARTPTRAARVSPASGSCSGRSRTPGRRIARRRTWAPASGARRSAG